jgi:parallel beta-helix repeat protein
VAAEGAASPKSGRVGAELDRVAAEEARVLAEGTANPRTGRIGAELDRVDAENARKAAEILRQAHINDKDNPHKVTAAQAGALSTTDAGDLAELTTTEKGSLVGAINEVDGHADTNATSIGTLASLTTTEKTNLVGAINELNADKIETTAIANTLTETVEGKVLDARQGKTLSDKIGNQTYTEQNYVTDAEPLTASIDKLDMQAKDTAELISTISGVSGVKTARFVVGTSTAGWTSADCDYLCDGTADQVEINNAITALPATGGEIVILDGTYNITAKIDVTKDNVSIRGNGNATILKRMFNSSVGEGVITLTGRSGCKIANLQIDGNKTSYTNNNNYCIYLEGSSNNTITGNTCNNNKGYGIYLYLSSSNNTVTGNTCNNNDSGIYLSNSSNNTIASNIYSNNNRGIYLSASSNNTVTGNTCVRGTGLATDYTTSQHTIQLSGTSNSYNLISNNNCMGKAVTSDGGTGNTLVNNKFDDSDDIQALADLVSTHTGATNPHGITKTTVGLDNVDNVKQATTTTYTTTLDTTWSGTEAPYTKEQTVTGILSTDNPIVDIVLSGTYATDSKIEADWAEIYRIVTSANSVTLYAHKKPTNSIPLQFKVVR